MIRKSCVLKETLLYSAFSKTQLLQRIGRKLQKREDLQSIVGCVQHANWCFETFLFVFLLGFGFCFCPLLVFLERGKKAIFLQFYCFFLFFPPKALYSKSFFSSRLSCSSFSFVFPFKIPSLLFIHYFSGIFCNSLF